MSAWIEYLKLASSVSTPIIVAVIGYLLNQRLKRIDEAQWQGRKIVEKRLELYDKIAPGLNKTFCFVMWVGYWKDISPKDLIDTKRDLDKVVNIYRHLLSERFYKAYNSYIHLIFQTYTGAGKDALILSRISGPDGNRRTDANYEWSDSFDQYFMESDGPKKVEIAGRYEDALEALRECIGLKPDRTS